MVLTLNENFKHVKKRDFGFAFHSNFINSFSNLFLISTAECVKIDLEWLKHILNKGLIGSSLNQQSWIKCFPNWSFRFKPLHSQLVSLCIWIQSIPGEPLWPNARINFYTRKLLFQHMFIVHLQFLLQTASAPDVAPELASLIFPQTTPSSQ